MHHHDDPDFVLELARRMKVELRQRMRALRQRVPPELREERSQKICAHVVALDIWRQANRVLLYMPMEGEVDVTPLRDAAVAAGKTVYAPRIMRDSEGRAHAFEAAEWIPQHSLHDGFAPSLSANAAKTDDVDLVVVPGLAFDLRGARLGYGKGMYDAFLANSHAVRLAVAFSAQLLVEVPEHAHDQRMHHLATEDGIHTVSVTSS